MHCQLMVLTFLLNFFVFLPWGDATSPLQTYLSQSRGNPAIMVVGTGDAYGVYNNKYFKVDDDRNIRPNYIASIVEPKFPKEFNDAFDIVIFERLPILSMTRAQVIQAITNAHNFLKSGGKLVFNLPISLQSLTIIRNKIGIEAIDTGLKQRPGLFYFRNNPYVVYVDPESEYKDFKINEAVASKALTKAYDEIIVPLLVEGHFNRFYTSLVKDAAKEWINPQRGDQLIVYAIK